MPIHKDPETKTWTVTNDAGKTVADGIARESVARHMEQEYIARDAAHKPKISNASGSIYTTGSSGFGW